MKRKVSYVSPCVTEENKVMVEVVYGSDGLGGVVFEPELMCERLSKFSNLKCSLKLGVARLEFKGKTILVNKNGKILVRKAEDKKDALASADYVSEVILRGR